MKRVILMVVIMVSCLTNNAQIISQTLEGVKCISFNNGVLVYGYEKDNDGYTFSITHYDKDLKVINKYLKKIPVNVNTIGGYCKTYGDHIDIYIVAKPLPYFIKLSSELKELSATEITPEVTEKDRSMALSAEPISWEPAVEKYTGSYERGVKNLSFINEHILSFNLKEESLVKSEPIQGLSLYTGYNREWATHIEGFEKVKATGIVYANEKDIVGCFITKGQNKLWDDLIVRFDSQIGSVKYKVSTVYPDKKERFFLSNAYFDPETEKVIAVGQLYSDKLVLEMHAVAILVYDKAGNLIASKMYEFPKYEIPDAPGNINLNQKAIVVRNIGKTKDGQFFLITEHRCLRKGTTFFSTVGFSYDEINAQGDVTSSIMTYIPDIKFGAIATVGQGNEKFIVLASSEEELLTVQLVDFEKGRAKMIQTIDSFDYMKNLKYVENKDVGIYKQFILDDKHTVIFHKYAKSDKYDLKSITVN